MSMIRNALLLGVLCCAAPAALAQEKCQFALVAQLPLNYSGPSLEVTASGTINGTPATMLVDTGADNIYLTRTGTDRRGLRVERTGGRGRGVGGTFNIMVSTVREIALGPVRTGKLDLEVIGNSGFTPSYDAILGGRFLFQTDVEISLPDKRLNFFKASGCGSDEFLGYWQEGAVDLPFRYDARTHPTPTFTVELNGQKMSAIIDSGAAVSLVNIDAARRAGFDPSAPGVTRAGEIVGMGTSKTAKWNAPFDSLSVGEEKIKRVRLGVVDLKEVEQDIVLGADFLRSHRVLFAMSQHKLYVSYAGGDVFSQGGDHAWIQREADAGNPDAEYVLAESYARAGAAPAAREWLGKATAHGQPQANLWTGRRLLAEGRYADAASHFKQALDQLPAERVGALSLYLARLRQGKADEARQELDATFAHDEADEWPRAIADFYLGRIDADALLARAALPAAQAKAHTCTAWMYMGELYTAQGRTAQAEAAHANYSAKCSRAAEQ